MKRRDSEAEAYVLYSRGKTAHEIGLERAAFTAGWNARKQAELEMMLHVNRPLHASAYEPLTPFKPRPAPLADTHFGDGSPTLTEPLTGRTVVVVHGGDQVYGRLHDDRP